MVRRSITTNNNPSVSTTNINANVPLYIGLIWVILLNLFIGGGILTPPVLAAAASATSATTNNTDATNEAANSPNAIPTNNSSKEVSPALKAKALNAFQELPLAFEPDSNRHNDPAIKYTARTAAYNLFFTDSGLTMALNLPTEPADPTDCAPTAQSAQAANTKNQPGPAISKTACSALATGSAAIPGANSGNNKTSSPNTNNTGKDSQHAHPQPNRQAALALTPVGGEAHPTIAAEKPLSGTVNYLVGNDNTKWKKDLATYATLTYQQIYQGVDLSFYGTQQSLEYDFKLAAGVDPATITLEMTGADRLEVDSAGNLVVHIGEAVLTQAPPTIYQLDGSGNKVSVAGGYRLVTGNNSAQAQSGPRFGFEIAASAYDHSHPLVIDPVLSYSTYVGSSGAVDDVINNMVVDSAGNIYLAGYTTADNFPTLPVGNPYQPVNNGGLDGFVTKLDPAGATVLYSTYLGGESDEWVTGLAVDSSGQVVVVGNTLSINYPTTSSAFQTTPGNLKGFVTRLNATGTALLYSSLLGGNGDDYILGLALDPVSAGRVWLTGQTGSSTFPTTTNAYQVGPKGNFDAFVSELDTTVTGTAGLVYSTYFGGNNVDTAVAIAISGTRVYLAGQTQSTNFPLSTQPFSNTLQGNYDLFVSVLNVSAGSTSLVYSTLVGGNDSDTANALVVDSAGQIYVTGRTLSTNFPTTANAYRRSGSFDVILVQIDPTLTGTSSLRYSTLVGGGGDDQAMALALDTSRRVYITGLTNSTDFTTTATAYQTTNGGGTDAYLAVLDPNNTGGGGANNLVYASYLGGANTEIGRAVVVKGTKVYLAGQTLSANFPTTSGVVQPQSKGGYDGFVSVLDLSLSGAASLVTSTYLGGQSHVSSPALAVNSAGEVYLVGNTTAVDFPTTTGVYQASSAGSTDAFVAKLDATGSRLLWATYLGGNRVDYGFGIALDSSGAVYLTGATTSSNFPTTAGAFKTSPPGGFLNGFVSKLAANGTSLLYSTYLGGANGRSRAFAIVVDSSGQAYVNGYTSSSTFPTTTNAYQKTLAGGGNYDIFLTKFNAAGTALLYSTYFGGTNTDATEGSLFVDGSGQAYFSGYTVSSDYPTTASAYQRNLGGQADAVLTKINTNGSGASSLVYSTLLGGSGFDNSYGVAVNASGEAFLTGYSSGAGSLPTTAGAYQTSSAGGNDMFLAKFNAAGSSLLYLTYLGGSGNDVGGDIELDSGGNVYVYGSTTSPNITTTVGAYQTALGGNTDAYLAKFNAGLTGGPVYATYFGGSGSDSAGTVALDGLGNLYLGGVTNSPDLPTTFGAYGGSLSGGFASYVAKLSQVRLVFITQPVGGPAGAVLTQQPVVQVQNAFDGSVVTSYNTPISLTLRPDSGTPGASLSGVTVVATPVNGTAVFTNVAVSLAGPGYILTAQGALLDPTDSAPFNVGGGAGQAATIRPYSGNNQSAVTNTVFSQPLVAQVLDNRGQPVSGASVTFTAPQRIIVGHQITNPTGVFADNTPTYIGTTDASGLVTTSIFTANPVVGTYSVTANVSGVSQTANFNLTNSPLISANRYGYRLYLTPLASGPNALNTVLTVTATLDRYDITPIANQPVTVTITSSDVPTATPVIKTGFTNTNGQFVFTYTRSFTTTDSFTATATVNNIVVVPNFSTIAYWSQLSNSVSTGSVTGSFFPSDGSCVFNKTPKDTAYFSQQFPQINFPSQRPWVDYPYDMFGNSLPGIPAAGNGYYAASNDLSSFQAVFTASLVVSTSGLVTFTYYSDDGWILGIGPNTHGDQPTYYNSDFGVITNGVSTTPFRNFPVVGAFNQGTGPSARLLTVYFPAPGVYPYEVDYTECGGFDVVLVMQLNGSGIASPPAGDIKITPTQVANPVNTGQSLTFTATVSDLTGSPAQNQPVALVINGANPQQVFGVTDNNGQASLTYTGNLAGQDTVRAISWPRGQLVVSPQVNVTFTGTNKINPGYPTGGCSYPIATNSLLSSPINHNVISGTTPLIASTALITGTVVDYWSVSNLNNLTTLTTTTQPTGSGVKLADFDGTGLPDGSYVIRVCGTDTSGNSAASLTLVEVAGDNKPGRVAFSLTDFTVPVNGMPIVIGRTYDSLYRSSPVGDFGSGWSMSLGDPKLEVNGAGDVTLTGPDGKRTTFYFTPGYPGPQDQQFLGYGQINVFSYLIAPFYTPEPGGYGRLSSDGCGILLNVAGLSSGGYQCLFGRDYQSSIQNFIYTDPYGRQYTIAAPTPPGQTPDPSKRPGKILAIQDLQGNLITIDQQGIKSSTRKADLTGPGGDTYLVRFGRKANNDPVCPACITAITDTNGYVYNYGYTGSDLTSFTMPGIVTPSLYSYYTSLALAHLFKSATDSRGNQIALTEYYTDPLNNGRLKVITDALGYAKSYSYTLDPATNFVTTTVQQPGDPFTGQTSIISITNDAYGKVVTSTDELGRTTAYDYDINHNAIHTFLPNPLNGQADHSRVLTTTYDIKGNKLVVADTLSHTTIYTYTPYSNPQQITQQFTEQLSHTYNVTYGQFANPTANAGYELPTSIDDSLGRVGGYDFNDAGNTIVRYDGNSEPTNFTFDVYGHQTSEGNAYGQTISYAYDLMGRMTFMTDAVGIANKYEYDYLGRLITSTIGYTSTTKAQPTVYTYDANGNKTSEKDALGRVTTYQYDALNRLVTTTYPVVNGQLYTTVKGYDWRGNVITDTDQQGRITRYQYDQGGQLITTTYALTTTGQTTADTATGVVSYDLAGRKVLEYNVFTGTVPPGGNISNVPATKYGYDSEGRVLTVTNQLDGALGGVHSTYYKYDAAGRKVGQTDGNNNSITYTLDERGRVVTTTYPAPTPGAAIISTVQQYDLAGQVVTSTDGGGRSTTYRYDAANRLQAVINPMNQATQYSYDPVGRLTAILDANNHKTAFQYDELGRQHYKIWPDNSYEQFEYDLVGNQTAHRLTDGITNTMGYDSWNRLTKAVYADSPVRTVVYTYTPTSQRQSVSDSSYGLVSYLYDNRDRVKQVTQPNNQSVGYGYDVRGNRVSFVITSTGILSTTSYGYDAASQLTGVTDQANNTTSFGYDNGGRRSTATLPSSVGIGVQYGYDQLNRLTDITQTKSLNVLARYNYALDGAGNRTAITETANYTSTLTRNLRYQYDPAYRLLAEWDSTQSGGITTTYGYDLVGNRLSMQTGAAAPATYAYNELDQLKVLTDTTGVNLYSYKRGDLVQVRNTSTGSTTSYTWDAADRLMGVTTATTGSHTLSFGYDADNHRVRQQQDSGSPINYLWDNYSTYGDVLLETTGTGATTFQASYVLANGELISQNKGGTTGYFLKDGQGSTRTLVGSTGSLIQNYNYSAFGNLQNPSGSYSTNYLYAGQQFDNLSGLYDLRARYYNPGDGIFLSRDTAQINLYTPNELNRFKYVSNNPVSLFDPTGLVLAELKGLWQGLDVKQKTVVLAAVGAWTLTMLTLLYMWKIRQWVVYHSSSGGSSGQTFPTPPNNPADAPGPDWVWKGNGSPGSSQGNWVNPKTGEYLHPDLGHPLPQGPHWDYRDPSGKDWRIYPDGRVEAK